MVLTVAFNISKDKTTQDLMAALSKMYEKPSTSSKVFLMKKLFNLKMGDKRCIIEYINEFNMLTSQLKSVGSISMTRSGRRFIVQSTRDMRWSRDGDKHFLCDKNLEI